MRLDAILVRSATQVDAEALSSFLARHGETPLFMHASEIVIVVSKRILLKGLSELQARATTSSSRDVWRAVRRRPGKPRSLILPKIYF